MPGSGRRREPARPPWGGPAGLGPPAHNARARLHCSYTMKPMAYCGACLTSASQTPVVRRGRGREGGSCGSWTVQAMITGVPLGPCQPSSHAFPATNAADPGGSSPLAMCKTRKLGALSPAGCSLSSSHTVEERGHTLLLRDGNERGSGVRVRGAHHHAPPRHLQREGGCRRHHSWALRGRGGGVTCGTVRSHGDAAIGLSMRRRFAPEPA